MTKLWTSLTGLSFVMKFAIGAGVFMVFYFVAIEPGLTAYGRFSARATDASAWLKQYATRTAQQTGIVSEVAVGESRYGVVEPPASFEQRTADMDESIREILEQFNVENQSITSRYKVLPPDTLSGAVDSGQRVERVFKEIGFDATPEQFAAVLAALEQSPVIVGVSRLDIRRDRSGQRRVLVSMTVDGWVLARKEGPR